jgi:N6-adenosine-specific RNA methylase IME4
VEEGMKLVDKKYGVKLYDVIYADPPWRYSFSKSKSRKIENQYPTMTVDEICSLDIPAKDNAVLYLWATAPKLLEALEVMAAWGFEYKTHAVWDKEKIGMGYWFRGQHELLLVGVKGKFSPPEPSMRSPSVLRKKREGHSSKPRQVREEISMYFPWADKIELFAREQVPGWACWGDEVCQVPDQNGQAV